jgi:helix-turn-helix protein
MNPMRTEAEKHRARRALIDAAESGRVAFEARLIVEALVELAVTIDEATHRIFVGDVES